ncbi:DUF1963 domain-containing protein [Amycolatopsis pigmentata]|uniref:DUF1963 domain-containing protein n=1 Tax=Amycolatopsis pigmentata TaxID=450801 RepID=A0ABW5G2T0_9PSEU
MDDKKLASGVATAGRFGGYPSVPADFEWTVKPFNHEFVASIDCAALPSDLPGLPLPAEGSLLFFGSKQEEYTDPMDARQGRVLYVPAGTPTEERPPPTDPDWEDHYSEPFPMYYTRHWAFPDSSDAVIMCNDEYYQTYDQYDLESVSFADEGDFALGGYCEPVQNEVSDVLTSTKHLGRTDWRLLAEWHAKLPPNEDLGLSYWAVPQADLEAGRFDRVGMCREIWHL